MKAMLFVLLLVVTATAPASAQIVFPASWAGVWDVTATEYTCGNSTPDTMYTEPDTLCAGEGFDPGEEIPGFMYQCSGGIDDTSLNVTCTVSGEIFSGCDVTFTFTNVGTRNGDTFTGTETYEVTYTGSCFGLQDECTTSDLSGTRTGPEPPECGQTPVLPATWGKLKDLYH